MLSFLDVKIANPDMQKVLKPENQQRDGGGPKPTFGKQQNSGNQFQNKPKFNAPPQQSMGFFGTAKPTSSKFSKPPSKIVLGANTFGR